MLHRAHALDGQVVMADFTEQEGLSRLDGARVIRLEADGRLAIHPNGLVAAVLPHVVVLLHPVLGSLGVTGARVVRLIIPLPRGAASDVCPRVIRSSIVATEPRTEHVVIALDTVRRHALHDAIANEVVIRRARRCRRVVRDTSSHFGVDLANFNTCARLLLRRIRRLRSNEASDKCATGGCCYSKGRHEARRYRPAFRCS